MKETPDNFLKLAMKAARAGGKIMKQRAGKGKIITWKNKFDYAADVDYKIEKVILKMIQKAYPKHNILTEERGKINKKSDYTWVIDPSDGTLNFMHNIPYSAVSIAVVKGDKTPIIGVVYAPMLNETYHAVKGKGAFLNGKRIHVSKETNIMKGAYAGAVHDVQGITSLPSALLHAFSCSSIELAYLACGRLSGRIRVHEHYEKYKYDPFGYAAGVLLVTEAGGKITDVHGGPWEMLDMKSVIASNGKLHKKLLSIFRRRR